MIVWIDGPYGVGKSTLAEAMHRNNPDSFLFDAEAVGNAVRDNLPKALFRGYIFEHYSLWHETIRALLREIASGFSGDVYVPMTLVFPDSFVRIADPLRAEGIPIAHVLLEAPAGTVRERILARGEEEGCWCMEHIGLCIENQSRFSDVIRVPTHGRTPEELAYTVKHILESR